MKISQTSTKDYYNTLIKEYDNLSGKVVMENIILQDTIFNAISLPKNGKINILDLGIGTASTTKKIITNYPLSFITGVDFSEEMIKTASRNLSDFPLQFRLIQADINDINLAEYGKFEVVISAVTIHNIPNDAKIKLFEKIFLSLIEGGNFINGDFIRGETDEEEAKTQAIYRNFLEKNLSGNELQKWLEHAFEFDMPMKLSEQKSILRKIGFKDIKILWEYPREVVYIATK